MISSALIFNSPIFSDWEHHCKHKAALGGAVDG